MTLAEKKREYMRRRYYARKAARVCCECTAKLEPEDGVRCEFCSDLEKERQVLYRQKASHKRADRKRSARLRAERRANGLCQFCNTPSGDRVACERHRIRAVAATIAWRERKRLGIVHMRTKRVPIVDPSRLDKYVPEPTWSDRVLRAMRWFDWASSTEVCEALGVSDPYSVDRNSACVAFGRLHKRGLLERRDGKYKNDGLSAVEYRLTAAGRAEIEQQRRAA